eukprot:CAMPEP_0197450692 /NCGR_PEP_ID=MMETSP1175-20131217/26199_1 /TAXON_ID=1003142 /ORGANISM="Triceratium dubium, Strain CCMP147" /LENGTH=259 /DNA_ID=CAMNT_0042983165 /DNA_START=55 /DNA_END=831 /DNA_ORIENTATION=-
MNFTSHNVGTMASIAPVSRATAPQPSHQQSLYSTMQSQHMTRSPLAKPNLQMRALNQNVLMWAGFFTASLLVYSFLSGGSFSFLLTYGAMARMFGFGMLIVQALIRRRTEGISVETLHLYCLVFVCRLVSICRHEGYLPYDKSGDWLYHLVEAASLAFTLGVLWACGGGDKFSSTKGSRYGVAYLAVPVLVVAVFIHPNANVDFLSDVAWTYAMYLESVALIPQLRLFRKSSSSSRGAAARVELLTAHFVAALGFGRLV